MLPSSRKSAVGKDRFLLECAFMDLWLVGVMHLGSKNTYPRSLCWPYCLHGDAPARAQGLYLEGRSGGVILQS